MFLLKAFFSFPALQESRYLWFPTFAIQKIKQIYGVVIIVFNGKKDIFAPKRYKYRRDLHAMLEEARI